jgi:hypothetical protein
MKLHPNNPTPGVEPVRDVLTYTKNEPHNQPAYYAIFSESVLLGTLEQEVDGFYYYFPTLRVGCYSAWILKDIAHKLEALNEAWNQRISVELSRAPMPSKTKITWDANDNEMHSFD